MQYQEYMNQLLRHKKLVPALGVVIITLLLLLLLSIGINYRLVNRVAVRLVPLHLTMPVTVSSTAVDSNYLAMMAVSVASLKLNVTPHTAQKQFNVLSAFVAPADYTALKNNLAHDAKRVVASGLTTSFAISGIAVDNTHLTVQLTGRLSRFEAGLTLKPVDTIVQVSFVNQNGVLQLTQLKEKKRHA